MKTINYHSFILAVLLNLIINLSSAQTVPQGITYQGIARGVSNTIITNQLINIKIGIYSPSVNGTLEWEEINNVTTNQLGLFYFIIGQGSSTNMGTLASFSLINWGATTHFIKLAMDQTGTNTSYVDIDTMQFWSVPYAMYSGASAQSNQPLRLDQLSDVDTLGVVQGQVLKYNGSIWVPAPDNNSDTANFAYTSHHSNSADTAHYALNVLSTIDTVLFSHLSDSSLFAANSTNSTNSTNSNYCDTANFALNSINSWNLNGNIGTNSSSNFIGTNDNTDFVLKTNNTEQMRITSAGRIGIGITAPTASLHIIGNDGLLAEGTFGTGAIPPSGAGTRMIWYPKKAAFRVGGIGGTPITAWNDVNIGNYSFACGYDTKASGKYSTAVGDGSGGNYGAMGDYSFSAGQASTASGICSIALGQSSLASGAYSVAFPRMATASDSGAIAIGYHNTASGKYSLSFGAYTTASGNYSTAIGWYASTNHHKGCFVFADYSNTAAYDSTKSTADNQFMARAAGGVVFYSNTALTSGVSLPAGGGAWASVSDRNKKEHFRNENGMETLSKLKEIEITSWNYKSQEASIRHIGPMAQDFYKAFHFGESDTTITTIDMDGVSLLAIQALIKKTEELKEKSEELEKLKSALEIIKRNNILLEARIRSMENVIDKKNKTYSIVHQE